MGKKYTLEKYERDKKIVSYIENNFIDLKNSYSDIHKKIDFLKSLGIMNLRVGKNTDKTPFIPIEESRDARISETVKKYYENAKNRIGEYTRGERNIARSELEKSNLVKKIQEKPEKRQLNLF